MPVARRRSRCDISEPRRRIPPREHSRPGIEELIEVGPVANQSVEKPTVDLESLSRRPFQTAGCSIAKSGGVDVLAGADAISRDREWSARESDHRQLASKLFLHSLEEFTNVRVRRRVRVDLQPVEIGERSNRPIRHRAGAGLELEREAHRDGERRDVVNEDDRIDAEAPRAERRAGRVLDVLGERVEAFPRADLVELWIPAAAAAGPHGRPLDSLAAPPTRRCSTGASITVGKLSVAWPASHQHTRSRCRVSGWKFTSVKPCDRSLRPAPRSRGIARRSREGSDTRFPDCDRESAR